MRTIKEFFASIFPKLYAKLILRGIFVEDKYAKLSVDRFDSYCLDDQVSDRDWYISWLISKKPCSVLEVGSGGMHELKTLQNLNYLEEIDYTVGDISKELLSEGKHLIPEASFANLNVNNIKKKDNSFDIVYLRHALEIQPIFNNAIDELFRVSKKYVVLNLWRWAIKNDYLKRPGRYYVNDYKISNLLNYISSKSNNMVHFICLRNDGKNILTDQAIVDSDYKVGDKDIVKGIGYLVIVASNDSDFSQKAIVNHLKNNNIPYILNPYSNQ